MTTFINKIINPKHKKLNWFNRNYCYLSTLIVIGVLCLCFFVFQEQIEQIVLKNEWFNVILTPFQQYDLYHLVGNIVSFFFISLFLERHFGSIKYLIIILLSIIPSSLAAVAFSLTWSWVGFGGVVFFLNALFFCIVLFHFKDYVCGKARWLFPLLILGVILFSACLEGVSIDADGLQMQFGVFTNFVANEGHWAAFLMGGIMGIFAEIYNLASKKKFPEPKQKIKKSMKNVQPILKSEQITVFTLVQKNTKI